LSEGSLSLARSAHDCGRDDPNSAERYRNFKELDHCPLNSQASCYFNTTYCFFRLYGVRLAKKAEGIVPEVTWCRQPGGDPPLRWPLEPQPLLRVALALQFAGAKA
jgi:hypothetical protein